MTDFIPSSMFSGGNLVANTITTTSLATTGNLTITSTSNVTVAGNLIVTGTISGTVTTGRVIAMNLIFGSG